MEKGIMAGIDTLPLSNFDKPQEKWRFNQLARVKLNFPACYPAFLTGNLAWYRRLRANLNKLALSLKKQVTNISDLPITTSAIISQLASGHSPLNLHLFREKRRLDPCCPHCPGKGTLAQIPSLCSSLPQGDRPLPFSLKLSWCFPALFSLFSWFCFWSLCNLVCHLIASDTSFFHGATQYLHSLDQSSYCCGLLENILSSIYIVITCLKHFPLLPCHRLPPPLTC
ncbi:hypothetical protein VP01_516g2 [Puccinia sorghi]|uniref:Uncharacterized protein n=1 Tax=Puccinia sorghi TaxID=27349 RepID=A0A0L6ULK9_9BASI|nr:hypothetical protein VP01_516g2 [Puccinia sorghi]